MWQSKDMLVASKGLLILVGLLTAAGCAPALEPEGRDTELNFSAQAASEPRPPDPLAAVEQTGDAPTTAPPVTDKTAPAAPTNTPSPQNQPTLDELLLFFPTKYPDGNWRPAGLRFEDVWIDVEPGVRVHGWYCPCEQPRAVVLVAHGNGGNLSYCGPLLEYMQKRLRVAVLIFDYRGYGRSTGVPTVKGVLEDARRARDLLAKRAGVKPSDVVLLGRSLGGAVVVQLAAELPPRGLVLESTFSSLGDAAAQHYPRLAWLVPADKLNSAAAIARYKGPLLASHGDADRTIPYWQGQKLFRAANEPKTFVTIPGGDHNDPQTAEYYQQLDRFIERLSPPPAAGSP